MFDSNFKNWWKSSKTRPKVAYFQFRSKTSHKHSIFISPNPETQFSRLSPKFPRSDSFSARRQVFGALTALRFTIEGRVLFKFTQPKKVGRRERSFDKKRKLKFFLDFWQKKK